MTNLLRPFLLGATVLAAPAAIAAPPYQATFTPLYVFSGGANGTQPNAPLAVDRSDTLYGTTREGGGANCSFGASICGTLFKINAQAQLTQIHLFTGATDGAGPYTGPILLRGTLFGTTYAGGGPVGVGIIYSVNTDGSAFTVLHTFNGHDGAGNKFPLLPDPAGGLYGIAYFGGPVYDPGQNQDGHGTVYLWEAGDKMHVLHTFTGGADGGLPTTLVRDAAGDLFGSTYEGRPCANSPRHGCGVIFKIDRTTRAFSVLYTFTGQADGLQPLLGSVGSDGTLYGAAQPTIAKSGSGVQFTLTPTGGGTYTFATGPAVRTGRLNDLVTSGPQPWTSGPQPWVGTDMVGTTQHSFYFDAGADSFGFTPAGDQFLQGPLTVGTDGTVYGTSAAEESPAGYGSVYRLTVTKTAP